LKSHSSNNAPMQGTSEMKKKTTQAQRALKAWSFSIDLVGHWDATRSVGVISQRLVVAPDILHDNWTLGNIFNPTEEEIRVIFNINTSLFSWIIITINFYIEPNSIFPAMNKKYSWLASHSHPACIAYREMCSKVCSLQIDCSLVLIWLHYSRYTSLYENWRSGLDWIWLFC
jgi:hypothetical protein